MLRRVLTKEEIKIEGELLSQQQRIIDRYHPPQIFVKGDIVRSREEPHIDRVFEVVHIKGPILHLKYRTGTPLPIITHAWKDLYHYKPDTALTGCITGHHLVEAEVHSDGSDYYCEYDGDDESSVESVFGIASTVTCVVARSTVTDPLAVIQWAPR